MIHHMRRPTAPAPEALALLTRFERMSLSVGSYLGRVSDLDNDLNLLIGNLVYDERPRFELSNDRRFSDKIAILEALWPRRWGEAREFTGALRKVANYRNRFAHWVPEIDFMSISEDTTADTVALVHRHPSGDSRKNMKFDPALSLRMEASCAILNSVNMHLGISLHGPSPLIFDSLQKHVLSWAESDDFEGWPKDPRWSDDVRFTFS